MSPPATPAPSLRALLEGPLGAPFVAHAEAAYPDEACALLFDSPTGPILQLTENLANSYHALDPEAFETTARTSYLIDPRLLTAATHRGHTLRAILHSHCDTSAAFSPEDLRLALSSTPDTPRFPNVDYAILAVHAGRADELAIYRWAPQLATFVAT